MLHKCHFNDQHNIWLDGKTLRYFPGEGNDNPLQYSCLKNSMDRRAWLATVCRVAKSWTQLSN